MNRSVRPAALTPGRLLSSGTWSQSAIASLVAVALCLATPGAHASPECVVLLHGLARTSVSMDPLEAALEGNGYAVANVDYPSRQKQVQDLAIPAVEKGLNACPENFSRVHFVTHSLGGILVRYFLARKDLPRLGRVVMIGPPNKGSHVVDRYRNVPGYGLLNGPAGLQLGTDRGSILNTLGPVDFPLGVIAGTRTFNPILSLSLPNPDDGKVSVENTKVEGMIDFLEVPHSHTFMMRTRRVISQVEYFLENGTFRHEPQG